MHEVTPGMLVNRSMCIICGDKRNHRQRQRCDFTYYTILRLLLIPLKVQPQHFIDSETSEVDYHKKEGKQKRPILLECVNGFA